MTKASENEYPKVTFAEGAAPGTPASGMVIAYAKTDGKLYIKDDAGTETDITTASSGSVATDAIWDTAGDLAVGSGANTAAKLAIGAAGGALSVINSAVAWNSGTSFPANKATGDRYWRTDLGMEFYWDGTRWLSTQTYTMGMTSPDAGFTADDTAYDRLPLPADYDVYLVKWDAYTRLSPAGTGSWTVGLSVWDHENDETSLDTFTYNNPGDTNWRHTTRALGDLIECAGSNAANEPIYLAFSVDETGGTDALQVGVTIHYRYVGT